MSKKEKTDLEKAQEELQNYIKILDDPDVEITLKDVRQCLGHLTFALIETIGMIDVISRQSEEIGKHHLKKKDKDKEEDYFV